MLKVGYLWVVVQTPLTFLFLGITQVLIDKPFGCLAHSSMPQQMNEFVKAIEDMMTTSHVLISFASVHKWLNTKIWQKHVSAWDKIIEVGKLY